MAEFLLQNKEKEIFSLDFTDRLAGDTISSILEVAILRSLPTRLVDRSGEFIISQTEQNGVVQVTLSAKSGSMTPGHYALQIRVETDGGRVLTGVHKIVIAEGRS